MTYFEYFVRKIILLAIIPFLVIGQGCLQKKKPKSEFCSEEDFKKMDKVDIHCHVNTKDTVFMNQAIEDNFRILSINTDAPLNVNYMEQQDIANFQRKAFPGHIEYLTTFSMKGWGEDDWLGKTIAYIKESMEKGAIGVKVWKNIGMVERDKDSSFIMLDNPGFDPLFDYLEENNIPVCGHLGEPKNCWLPIDEMTVNNDKEYYKEYPQFHMYLHPGFPSYEEQINARDRMLEKHPGLKFMGAHLGSLEWSVDELAKFFDKFPNATVDMAARICHLQLQAQSDWQKVHDFFIKYQDRIIYGTDMGDYLGASKEPEKLKKKTHTTWVNDWKFLTTDEVMSVKEINGEFKGLKLPREVVEKIYYKNAEKMFPGI